MINIEEIEVFGWEAAIRGMRNPLNSWDKSDSSLGCIDSNPDGTEIICKNCGFKPDWCGNTAHFIVGNNDLSLMKKLANAGNDHAKFLRMINVTVDITAPLYWWKEFDTYKVGTVANSCSTMHKIAAKEFILDDFSHEHLFNGETGVYEDDQSMMYDTNPYSCLKYVIYTLNYYRNKFNETKDKSYWWQMIQLLPSSYNQKRTVQLNYQVLKSIYSSRKNHKLDEWHDFCAWCESLPYFQEICLECNKDEQ